MSPVFSFGEVLVDMLPTQDGQFAPMAGGAPANVSVAVAKLGGTSYFLGGLSEDNMGQMLTKALTDNNVDTRFTATKINKTAIVLVTLDQDGERSFEFYRDNTADLAFNSDDLAKVQWQQDGILHLCSNTLCTDQQHQLSLSAVKAAKEYDMTVCIDVNLRLNLWLDSEVSNLLTRVEQIFQYSDIVKLSLEELEWLAQNKQVTTESYLSHLVNTNCQLVLVTDGSNDIRVITKHDSQTITPPKAVAVDTTGAGDSFIGGFLFQLATRTSGSTRQAAFATPMLIAEFVDFASQCGAHTVQAKGAFAAMPTLKDLGM